SYTFALVGSWPTGVSIDSSTGVVSGTPTVDGTFGSLNIKVTDGDGDEYLLGTAFSIVVTSSVPLVPTDIADLWVWYEFDLESGINGSTIPTVTDQSGNSRTLTTAGSPTVLTGAQNSLKAGNFGSGNGGKKAT